MKKALEASEHVSIWPSHAPFEHMISYSVRGHDQPVFKNCCANDHIAELCLLELDDTEKFLWFGDPASEGQVMREMFDSLENRIHTSNDLAAAEIMYAIATHAAFRVLSLFLRNRDLFDQITPWRRILPSLISIHPKTAKVTEAMAKASKLGKRTREAPLIRSKAWFTSDAPANVYARAIIHSVEMNKCIEPVEVQQANWASYTQQHGVRIQVQPYPKFIAGIEQLPVPMTPRSVLAYWRKGKEIILEEMPNFHLRPEWESYHRRNYQHGAKTGAVQHAIFKDILVALRTIAGGNKDAVKVHRRKPKRDPK